MGVDIHMFVVKDKQILVDVAKEVFDNFRNYEWFDNISGDGFDEVYDHFPVKNKISPQMPDALVKESEYFGCYGCAYINVSSFKMWFRKMRPDIDAGWVTSYEKWQYEKKNILPRELNHDYPEDANSNDIHFIEVENAWEPSRELFDYLEANNIDPLADIVFWFDH